MMLEIDGWLRRLVPDLAESAAAVCDVAFAAGFGSVSQFYDRFTSSCGTTPRRFRLDMRS